ncbi:hypothetical protein MNQ95_13655 [Pseudoxanthomonas daejeonensis]|uniref:hypothetical protein n=1 Tax=Pseudoxanthomonas daejeonensis TaxID=266062 RepID=UPI001F5430B7|nr:hypothetical protein [Pseudoxanthomonas daejeonensis]UNK57163.1 hypothetical protein MNQ95_13655 [Pseudoxanthomonas daejeonensis]
MGNGDPWETAPVRFLLGRAYHDVAEVLGWQKAVDFGMDVWARKRPPSERKAQSVYGGGHGSIYIPEKVNSFFGHELVELLGEDDAKALSARLGGEILEFSAIAPAFKKQRNQAILDRAMEGLSPNVIAFLFELTPRSVRRIIHVGMS